MMPDISTRTGVLKLSEDYGKLAMMKLYANVLQHHDRSESDRRLLTGLERFGTEMFHWDPVRRQDEINQEISDSRNYILSGIWYEWHQLNKDK
jgi:hypothetical protein